MSSKKKTKQQETLAVMRVPTEKFEAAKAEMMKMVEGVQGAEKLGELLDRGYKKGKLSSAELMEVLDALSLETEQLDKLYDTMENLGIDTAADEDFLPWTMRWGLRWKNWRTFRRRRSWIPTLWWIPSRLTTQCGCTSRRSAR